MIIESIPPKSPLNGEGCNGGQEVKYVFADVEQGDIPRSIEDDISSVGKSTYIPSERRSETQSDDRTLDSAQTNRAQWGGKVEFLLTLIGFAVGLGNVWRFPFLCYKNGGGAFLIPYVIMLAFVGLPLFYMEIAFGQFASLGPISIWKMNPLFKGLGYTMVISSWIVSLYYNVVISHTLHYIFSSMTSEVPWAKCNHTWNTNRCLQFDYDKHKATTLSPTTTTTVSSLTAAVTSAAIKYKTPAEEYYENYILQQTDGIEHFGVTNWRLMLCLLLAWILVYISIIKGVQSLGKVVYFTAIFPYIMLTIMLIKGATMEGAGNGIIYYLKPDFSRLADPRVWSDAATQIFYSLSACSGGMIAMSSFSKFKNNCYRDAIMVALINCGTSIYAGFVVFSVLGYISYIKGIDVKDVAAEGPGLAFVVYPEALASMPVAPLWSIFFFLMMATLGFGSQFSMIETVLSAFIDEFPQYLSGRKASMIFRTVVIFASFLLGLPMVSGGGIYLLNLVDYYMSGFPLLLVGLCECIALNWIYGYSNFANDIKMMVGFKPNIYWKACWIFISPFIIFVIIILNMIFYKEPTMDTYTYPDWANAIGWLMAIFTMIWIPGWILVKFCYQGGYELLKEQMQPSATWGPAKIKDRKGRYSNVVKLSTDTLENGLDNNGYGSNGRITGSRRASTLSNSNSGRLRGSRATLSTSAGKLSGSRGTLSSSNGRLGGSRASLSGSRGRLGGSRATLSGSNGRLGGSRNTLSTPMQSSYVISATPDSSVSIAPSTETSV